MPNSGGTATRQCTVCRAHQSNRYIDGIACPEREVYLGPSRGPLGGTKELHVKVLAAFPLILGVLGLMGSLMIMLIFGVAAGIINMTATDNPDAFLAVPIVGLIGGILVVVIFTLSVPGIIAGIGLLKRRLWAHILTIVLSVLHLLNIPFGTLLGIYGLWVLLQRNTAPLFGVTPAAAPVAPPTGPTV